MTACPGCGYDYDAVPVDTVVPRLHDAAASYRRRLTGHPPDVLHSRPVPGTWSAVEYGCHVRDILLVQRDRMIRAVVETRPDYPPMWRDERVEVAGYADEDPASLADQIDTAVHLFSTVFLRLGSAGLERTCIYNYPEPTERTMAWMGVHTLHEVVHHLGDIDSGLA